MGAYDYCIWLKPCRPSNNGTALKNRSRRLWRVFEGFIGGALTTMVLAAIIAPWLTPLTLVHSLAAGLIISVGGFIGDLNISAIKRDMGVKDSSSLIPGHGGVLDRVDSLSFTAPLFFHFIYFFYY